MACPDTQITDKYWNNIIFIIHLKKVMQLKLDLEINTFAIDLIEDYEI